MFFLLSLLPLNPSSKDYNQDRKHAHMHTHIHSKLDTGLDYVSEYLCILKLFFLGYFFFSFTKYITILCIIAQAYWGGRHAMALYLSIFFVTFPNILEYIRAGV